MEIPLLLPPLLRHVPLDCFEPVEKERPDRPIEDPAQERDPPAKVYHNCEKRASFNRLGKENTAYPMKEKGPIAAHSTLRFGSTPMMRHFILSVRPLMRSTKYKVEPSSIRLPFGVRHSMWSWGCQAR